MKIASSIEQYFDDEGRPLVNGRVSFYLHDSDNLANMFYLNGDTYVEAPNPLTTSDDGRVPTVFYEATVLDVKVEKKLPDGSYELMDTFQIGFDVPRSANDTIAYGISGLQETDPSVGIVQVVGYYSDYDAPARWYVWDPNCQLVGDGGVIVESNVGEAGRWILLWDDELLPSSIYGILPGENESNISAFLNYPDFIGTYMVRTPPMPRFLSGTYTSVNNYSTPRTIYFDNGAQFSYSTIVCNSVVIPDNSSYVGDFSFLGKGVTAHSSWFRTAQYFWHCDADTFVIDFTNYMTNYTLSTTATLTSKVIVGASRLGTTYANGAYLRLNNCAINGKKVFSPRYDKLYLTGMTFDQAWFVPVGMSYWDFGSMAGGHMLQVRAADNNIVRFERFTTPDVYLKWCLAEGQTSFDGHGASYSYTNNTQFVTIKNCTITTALADSECDTWENVKLNNGVSFSGQQRIITMTGCELFLNNNTGALRNMYLNDCTTKYSAYPWCPNDTSLSVSGGTFGAAVTLSDAAKSAYTRNKSLIFDKVTVTSTSFDVNDITMRDCKCSTHIYLTPYYEEEKFQHHCVFERNRFINGFLIEIKPRDMIHEYGVYNVLCNLTFLRNDFEQTDSRGIVMPYSTNVFDWNKMYIDAASNPLSTYKGNMGNCPAEHPTSMFLSSNLTETYNTGSTATDIKYMPLVWKQRVWNMNPYATFTCGFGWQCTPGDSWNRYTGKSAQMHEGRLFHLARALYTEETDDQFCVVHAWEEDDDFSDNKLVVFPQ